MYWKAYSIGFARHVEGSALEFAEMFEENSDKRIDILSSLLAGALCIILYEKPPNREVRLRTTYSP